MWDLCSLAGDIVELIEGLTSEGLVFFRPACSRSLHRFLLSREGAQQLWREFSDHQNWDHQVSWSRQQTDPYFKSIFQAFLASALAVGLECCHGSLKCGVKFLVMSKACCHADMSKFRMSCWPIRLLSWNHLCNQTLLLLAFKQKSSESFGIATLR